MFMPWPILERTSFSMRAGGGVHGTIAGTVHVTMTETGLIIPMPRHSTETFLRIGDIITEVARGREPGGNLSGVLIKIFSATGVPGRKTDTGKNKDTVFIKMRERL
jgi:hypothetical protein